MMCCTFQFSSASASIWFHLGYVLHHVTKAKSQGDQFRHGNQSIDCDTPATTAHRRRLPGQARETQVVGRRGGISATCLAAHNSCPRGRKMNGNALNILLDGTKYTSYFAVRKTTRKRSESVWAISSSCIPQISVGQHSVQASYNSVLLLSQEAIKHDISRLHPQKRHSAVYIPRTNIHKCIRTSATPRAKRQALGQY